MKIETFTSAYIIHGKRVNRIYLNLHKTTIFGGRKQFPIEI